MSKPKKAKPTILGTATTLTPRMQTPGELAIAERLRRQPQFGVVGWASTPTVKLATKKPEPPKHRKESVNLTPAQKWKRRH